MFYRKNARGNCVLFHDDGSVVTRLNEVVWPVNSLNSSRYEHPNGIVLAPADAEALQLRPEFVPDLDA